MKGVSSKVNGLTVSLLVLISTTAASVPRMASQSGRAANYATLRLARLLNTLRDRRTDMTDSPKTSVMFAVQFPSSTS